MTLWSPDTCGCQVRLFPNGGLQRYERRCNLHQDAPLYAPLGRSRARQLARLQIQKRDGGADTDEPIVEFDDEGRAVASHLDFMAAKLTRKTVAPPTTEEWEAAVKALMR